MQLKRAPLPKPSKFRPRFFRPNPRIFEGILLENINELDVAFEATRRALLRSRLLQHRGMFLHVEAPLERHTVWDQAVIGMTGELRGLDTVNRTAATLICSARAAHQQTVPLYVFHKDHPDLLARAIVNFDEPFRDSNPLKIASPDNVTLSGREKSFLGYLAPELAMQLAESASQAIT